MTLESKSFRARRGRRSKTLSLYVLLVRNAEASEAVDR